MIKGSIQEDRTTINIYVPNVEAPQYKKQMLSDTKGAINSKTGVPIVAQCLVNQTSIHEDVGLIPGLAHWVEDLAFLQAAVQVTDVAWIWCCCGCGVGLQLQL